MGQAPGLQRPPRPPADQTSHRHHRKQDLHDSHVAPQPVEAAQTNADGTLARSENRWYDVGKDREVKRIVFQADKNSQQVRGLMRVEGKLHEFEKRNQEKGRQRQPQCLCEQKVL